MPGGPGAADGAAPAPLAGRAAGRAAVPHRRRGAVRGLLRLAPSSAASSPSAGRCRRASSTCSPSSAPPPTACRPRAARACSARWRGTGSTPWPRTRRTRCATSSCAAGRGRRTSAGPSSTTARPTWTRSRPCCRACCPASSPASATASIALGQALLRGRYMAAAARMEWTGVPIDTDDARRASGPAGAASRRG